MFIPHLFLCDQIPNNCPHLLLGDQIPKNCRTSLYISKIKLKFEENYWNIEKLWAGRQGRPLDPTSPQTQQTLLNYLCDLLSARWRPSRTVIRGGSSDSWRSSYPATPAPGLAAQMLAFRSLPLHVQSSSLKAFTASAEIGHAWSDGNHAVELLRGLPSCDSYHGLPLEFEHSTSYDGMISHILIPERQSVWRWT